MYPMLSIASVFTPVLPPAHILLACMYHVFSKCNTEAQLGMMRELNIDRSESK